MDSKTYKAKEKKAAEYYVINFVMDSRKWDPAFRQKMLSNIKLTHHNVC